MKKNQSHNFFINSRLSAVIDAQKNLLIWLEVFVICICLVVLVSLLLFFPKDLQAAQKFRILFFVEILIILVAIIFNLRDHYVLSSSLFVLASLIGPWWSAFIDSTMFEGNLLPLVFTTLPIYFSSIFSPVFITLIIGFLQMLSMTLLITKGNLALSNGASSLFFYVVFIFFLNVIFNFINRDNQNKIRTLLKQLTEEALRDSLTGLNNRRFLFDYLEKEFARLQREKEPLSILVCDIDDLKKMNDTCGHLAGDSILISFSNLLGQSFRQSDVICRYGGDEFIIVMSGIGIKHAHQRAVELKEKVDNVNLNQDCVELDHTTISVGIACYPQHGENTEALIKKADRALYEAKKNGKNRIEVAT